MGDQVFSIDLETVVIEIDNAQANPTWRASYTIDDEGGIAVTRLCWIYHAGGETVLGEETTLDLPLAMFDEDFIDCLETDIEAILQDEGDEEEIDKEEQYEADKDVLGG